MSILKWALFSLSQFIGGCWLHGYMMDIKIKHSIRMNRSFSNKICRGEYVIVATCTVQFAHTHTHFLFDQLATF